MNYYDDDKYQKKRNSKRSRDSDDEDIINFRTQNDEVIRIRPFDFDDMPPYTGLKSETGKGVRILVIGRSGSGKSTLLRDIIAAKSHLIPVAQVFSGTEDSNHTFSAFIPDVCIHNKLDIKALENFKIRQKFAGQHLEYPYCLNVIDDCADDVKILKKPIFHDIYKNGRHWWMLHVLTLQYCLDIPPAIRNNYDYAFIFKENIIATREKLHKYFGACINKLSDFNNLLDTITGDYTALVIKNSVTATNAEDCLFWYKADIDAIPKGWKFGSDDFWEFHKDRRDPNASDISHL